MQVSYKCDQCNYFSNSEESFQQHMNIHQAELISNTLHHCPKCNNSIPLQGQKNPCERCFYLFHKQCTDRKGKGGTLKVGNATLVKLIIRIYLLLRLLHLYFHSSQALNRVSQERRHRERKTEANFQG